MQKFVFQTTLKSHVTTALTIEKFEIGTVFFSVDKEYRTDERYVVQINDEDEISSRGIIKVNAKEISSKKPYILLNAETEVFACNDEEAFNLGREKVNQAVDIITLFTNSVIDFVEVGSVISEDGRRLRQGKLLLSTVVPIAEPIIILSDKFNNLLTNENKENQVRIQKSLHFYRRGILEEHFEAKLIFYWIALECLSSVVKTSSYPRCNKCKKYIEKCIHCGADTTYEPSEKTLVKELLVNNLKLVSNSEFDKMYKIRSSLIHGGKAISQKEIDKINTENEKLNKLISTAINSIIIQK